MRKPTKELVGRARAEVTRVEQVAARWHADAAVREAEATDLEGRAGALVLDDETALSRLSAEIGDLRAGARMAQQAAAEAERRLDGARRDLLRARAVELRENVAAIRADVESRMRRTKELVALLSSHEGVDYEPRYALSPIGGAGIHLRTKSDRMLREAVDLEIVARRLDDLADNSAAVDLSLDPVEVRYTNEAFNELRVL